MKQLKDPQRVTITFEGPTYASLTEISRSTGVPVAELIRRQMASFIKSNDKKPNDRPAQR